jgi:hypothetical protein
MDKPMTPETPSQIDSPEIPMAPAFPVPTFDILTVAESLLPAGLPLLGRLGAAEKVRSVEPERMTRG